MLGVLLIAAAWISCFLIHSAAAIAHPVILVPGYGGSQLFVKAVSPVNYQCSQPLPNYTLLWLDITINPFYFRCLIQNLKLSYNATTKTTHDNPDVHVAALGFGNTTTVDYFIPYLQEIGVGWVFQEISDMLVSLGYTRGISIRGAPYDFRRAPNELQDFFYQIQLLIEDTYHLNNKTRVALLSHSMGSLQVLYFLNRMSQAWKDTYIRTFISMAGPWGGSVKAIQVLISGFQFHVPWLHTDMRAALRSFPASSWLLPSSRFWDPKETLVVTPFRNYSLEDLKQLLSDVNATDSYAMWTDTLNLTFNLEPPGTEVYCLYGTEVKTAKRLYYLNPQKGWMNHEPELEYGDGDGTVGLQSLEGCLPWAKQQKQSVYNVSFPGINHLHLLWNDTVLTYIRKILLI